MIRNIYFFKNFTQKFLFFKQLNINSIYYIKEHKNKIMKKIFKKKIF